MCFFSKIFRVITLLHRSTLYPGLILVDVLRRLENRIGPGLVALVIAVAAMLDVMEKTPDQGYLVRERKKVLFEQFVNHFN